MMARGRTHFTYQLLCKRKGSDSNLQLITYQWLLGIPWSDLNPPPPPNKKAVLSVACLYSIVTPQPKPISVWSSSSSSRYRFLRFTRVELKPTYYTPWPSTFPWANSALRGVGGRGLSDEWLVCLPVCLRGPHLNSNPHRDNITHT